jgi:hypothetical protein
MAFIDTIADALTVRAAKINVKNINENLNTMNFLMEGTGSIIGALISVFIDQTKLLGPIDSFSFYLLL